MIQTVNKAYKDFLTTDKRYTILMGGRGAGRSTVASQLVTARLVAQDYFRCAIMRLVLGDIRNSIYREIIDRADESGIRESLDVNDTQMVIKYGQNTINAVGFKKSSGEQKAKLKSLANYNFIVIEEADEIGEEEFMQLDDSLRTMKGDIRIILLLNPPPKNHWIIKRWFNLVPSEEKDFYIPELKPEIKDTLVVRTSYLDNIQNIDEQTKRRYEGYRVFKPAHYWNMIRGYVPETVKGKIYNNWQEIDKVPFEARLERRALDFGYTNDPTAIVDIYYYNGAYILDEICYMQGMSNRKIADLLNAQREQVLVVADSAEPKSIYAIEGYGVQILPAVKGTGSINTGIQYVQDQKIYYTSRSKNIKDEYENYAWQVTKDGEVLNTPIDAYNHSMDALRYGLTSILVPDKYEPRVAKVSYSH